MAEMLYAQIKPKEEYANKHYLASMRKSTEYHALLEDIKKHGIKWPCLAPCDAGHISNFNCGIQRMGIALDLSMESFPIILYSIHGKTGFQGQLLRELSDVTKLFGEGILDEPVYSCIVAAYRRIMLSNNFVKV